MVSYRLVDEHYCIRQARVIGLFGCADLVDTAGPNAGNRFTTLQGGGPSNEKVLAFKRAMLDEGIISLFRNWCATLSSAVCLRNFRKTRCVLRGFIHPQLFIVPAELILDVHAFAMGAVACCMSHHRW